MPRLTATPLKEITEAMFKAYVKVQMSGRTNMWDTATVSVLSRILSREDVLGIITNYETLSNKFPKVVA
jgi:hypothetical protein